MIITLHGAIRPLTGNMIHFSTILLQVVHFITEHSTQTFCSIKMASFNNYKMNNNLDIKICFDIIQLAPGEW